MERNEKESSLSVVISKFGGYDCIEVKNWPLAELADNDVEVKVAYCGLNFADLYTRQGLFFERQLPMILGAECSGIITRTGCTVDKFKVGDKVICYNCNGGLHRQILRISQDRCFSVPDGIDLKCAAAIFVNYLTAYFAVYKLGNLKDNGKIFVPSCAGGVGWAATQLSKLIPNVKIIGTCSNEKKSELAKSNGVDQVLLYDNLNEKLLADYTKFFDVVIDSESGPFNAVLQKCVNVFGKIVTIGASYLMKQGDDQRTDSKDLMQSMKYDAISKTSLIFNNVCAGGLHLGVLAENHRDLVEEALKKIFDWIVEGKLKPHIDSVWDLEQVRLATEKLGDRTSIGKVLLRANEYP